MLFLSVWCLILAPVSASALPKGQLVDKTTVQHVPRDPVDPILDDLNHNYTFSELRPHGEDRGPGAQPYFRFLILFKKKAGVTDAYFNSHWASVHADITMRAADVGIQLLRYVQVSRSEP